MSLFALLYLNNNASKPNKILNDIIINNNLFMSSTSLGHDALILTCLDTPLAQGLHPNEWLLSLFQYYSWIYTNKGKNILIQPLRQHIVKIFTTHLSFMSYTVAYKQFRACTGEYLNILEKWCSSPPKWIFF